MPKSLLRSPVHSGLSVVAWAFYETLTVRQIEGGRRLHRRVATARRCEAAARLGVSEKTLDRARRELLDDGVPGGARLSRSAPRGKKRSVLHAVLRLPSRTGEPYAKVPNLLQPAAQMRQHIRVTLSGPRREPLTDQLQPESVHQPSQRPRHPDRVTAVRRSLDHVLTSIDSPSMKETVKLRRYEVNCPAVPLSASTDPPGPA